MSSNLRIAWLALAGTTLAAIAAPAPAQEASPSPGGDALGRRFEAAIGTTPSSSDGLGSLVTGYEDLVLLEQRQFFRAWASLSPQFTSNAQLTPDGDHDYFAVLNVGIRAATVLADKVNVYATLGALTSRYDDFDDLDYSALTGSFGADRSFPTPVGNVNLGLDYSPAVILQRDFSGRQQTRHRFSASAQMAKSLADIRPLAKSSLAEQVLLLPSITIEHVFTDPEEYEYSAASGDFALLYRPARDWQFGASVGAFYREYNNYFTDLVGSDRSDKGLRTAIYAQWTPLDFLTVTAAADYTHNNSTSDVSGYNALTLAPGITVTGRF